MDHSIQHYLSTRTTEELLRILESYNKMELTQYDCYIMELINSILAKR